MTSRIRIGLAAAGATLALAVAPATFAQSASASGAQAAETQSPSPTTSESPGASRTQRDRPSANPAMRTGQSPEPLGPDTSTVQPDTNDLTGSTGASIAMPQAEPPPGVMPPNGSAPDTGRGAGVDNTQNAEGGPH